MLRGSDFDLAPTNYRFMDNEELQRLVMHSLGGCSWEYDVANESITYSDEFLALLGYRPGERRIDSDWVEDNIHPKDLSMWHDSLIRNLRGESRFFDCELRFRRRDDRYIWIQTRGLVTDRDAAARALRVVGLVFDISERKAAKESESRYRLFLDNIPDALSLKDRDGRYIFINRQFESWIGKPSFQIYGKTADEIFASDPAELEAMKAHEREVWERGENVSMKREFPRTEDGRERHAVITKFPIFDEAGAILGIGTTNTDISEHYRAQEAVRMSEVRYRRLFESAPAALYESDWSRARELVLRLREQGVEDIGEHLRDNLHLIRRRDEVQPVLNANQEAVRIYGSESVESHLEFVQGDLIDEQKLAIIEVIVAFDRGRRRSRAHAKTVRENGEIFPIIRTCELTTGDRDDWSSVLICIQDISAEVEAATRLQEYQAELRSLSGKISLAEESERRRISSELHDGTVQSLVLSRIQLAELKQSLTDEPARRIADGIDELLDKSLKETRSLIFEISPPVLYELGLEAAVEWLAENYRRRTGLKVTISSDGGKSALGEELKVVVFQAVRELMVNVAKHARAKTVAIDWRHASDALAVSVIDDGIGFDVDSNKVRTVSEGGFGLFSIRERLNLLGAEFDLESSAAGTRATIIVPM